jgi:hypothetical protein
VFRRLYFFKGKTEAETNTGQITIILYLQVFENLAGESIN